MIFSETSFLALADVSKDVDGKEGEGMGRATSHPCSALPTFRCVGKPEKVAGERDFYQVSDFRELSGADEGVGGCLGGIL